MDTPALAADQLQDRQREAGYGLGLYVAGRLVRDSSPGTFADEDWSDLVDAWRFIPGFASGMRDADEDITGVPGDRNAYIWFANEIQGRVEDVEADN